MAFGETVLRSRRVRVGALGLLLVGVVMISVPMVSRAAAPTVGAAQGRSAIYDTALNYMVRFYPRWFTYKQPRTVNRLIAPRRIGPVYKAVVAVNDDTLYGSGFVDVSSQPVVLTIPSTTVTYSLLVLNAYGNVVTTTIPPQTPGVYALTGPGWTGTLPAGVTKVPLSVNFANVIIRADKYSGGTDNMQQATQFRSALRLQPLSDYVTDPAAGATRVLPVAYFSISYKRVADQETTKAPISFLKQLQEAVHDPRTPPLSASDAELSARFDALFHGGDLTASARAQFARAVRAAHALIVTRYHSHTIGRNWISFTNIGTWGDGYNDSLDRDAITEYIQYGNTWSTAAYYQTFQDGSGAPLSGATGRGYVLTFSKGEIPEAKRFWSLTAYVPGTVELVPNRARKYVVASYTPGLKTRPDGSIAIYMTRTRPAGVPAANWLPIPRGRFNIMLRVYGPQGRVENNTYVPPAIRRRTVHPTRIGKPFLVKHHRSRVSKA